MKYIFIFSLILFVSCNVSNEGHKAPENITFKTSSTSYEFGSAVKATLQNNSDKPLGYNLCPTKLEQKEGEKWILKGPDITCKAILKILQPGEAASYQIQLADSLVSDFGVYRLTTGVEVMDNKTDPKDQNVELKTQEFEVYGFVQL